MDDKKNDHIVNRLNKYIDRAIERNAYDKSFSSKDGLLLFLEKIIELMASLIGKYVYGFTKLALILAIAFIGSAIGLLPLLLIIELFRKLFGN